MKPLRVIGAGPAGSVAAFTAARLGASVNLYERGSFPRDRVCGEFISAEALPLLTAIIPDLVTAAPVIGSVRLVSSRGFTRSFPLPQPARGISRCAFDAALADAAVAAGATLHIRSAVMPQPGDIVAIGRDFAPRSSPWLGVKAHVTGLEPRSEVEMFFFRGGYCGLAPVENGHTNVCCLLHRRRAADLRSSRDFVAWLTTSAGSPALLCRLAGAVQATPTVVTAQVRLGPRAAVANGALLCGDASGFLDPFAGDGLARAMLSGQLAARLALESDPEAAYAAALRRTSRTPFRAAGLVRCLPFAMLPRFAHPDLVRVLLAATRWRD